MPDRTPAEIAPAAVEQGVAKASRRWDSVVVGSFLAGAYIAFGALVAISVSSGMDPGLWGTLPTLFLGGAFTLGLVLVVIGGADLLTGNMMLLPLAVLRRRLRSAAVLKNLAIVLVGNLAGAVFVAYFFAVQAGVVGDAGSPAGSLELLAYERLVGITESKGGSAGAWEVFLRAVACNWLVCLAIWLSLASDRITGKILGIFFPIMAFVAMGFDHVVANMFFLPAAMFAGVPGLTWSDVTVNLSIATVGNLVGGVVFVALAYWYLYLKDEPADA
ncbi:formate/nitrite transporter family protein [Pseudonocardia kongjuensis]|uniref:Formate/nitrite transporter family protein n=1 Tax=Pseudonocardia kongjuensis TaxID=102227 RepID=A0ABN1Y405_9PSEU